MFRSARYGLPPPPVPRIQAPIASDSISAAETGRRAIGSVCYPPAIAMQTRWCALQAVAGPGLRRLRCAHESRSAMRVLVTAVLAVLLAATPAPAFERVGDRKILVFAGRQE